MFIIALPISVDSSNSFKLKLLTEHFILCSPELIFLSPGTDLFGVEERLLEDAGHSSMKLTLWEFNLQIMKMN